MERKPPFAYVSILLMGLLVGCAYGAESKTGTRAPAIKWHRGYGTDYEEHVHEGFQTSDGGYIGIGHAREGETEYTGMLVIKIDSKGNHQWQKRIGTSRRYDVGICVDEASDGYVVGGALHWAENQQRGLAKLDADGRVVWKRTHANSRNGAIRGIDITNDGGIVATGYVKSPQQGFGFIADDSNGFIMKTDADGNLQWDKTLAAAPQGTKVREDTSNGGFAVCSTVWVFDGGDHQNVCLIKTDKQGNEIWSKNYGSSGNDQCFDFDLTSDGGCILAGHTLGYGVANWDYLLLKVDKNGNEEWHSTFGQPRGYDAAYIHDECYGVRQTPDGGYLMAGGTGDENRSYSASGSPHGRSDTWQAYLVKTDARGNRLWERTYGDTMATVTGSNEIYAQIIRHARSKTDTSLWVNEGQILPGGSRVEDYEKIIRYLVENKAQPDGIGFMAHFKEGTLRSIDGLWEVNDRFAKFGVPLQLAEFDIDTRDEQLQADYLRDVMTITFSHPSLSGIVMWGFWEGRHWRPNGALWRKDWSIKPAGKMWKELVFKTWRTGEERTADASGVCELSAFLGDYEVAVEHAGRAVMAKATVTTTVTVDKSGRAVTIKL